ncbi:MAG: hypothetical protein R2909_08225 [Gemmatimonadales bacterium]
MPGWVNPTAEVKYVTLEYGLYENRWWMPRYVAIDATGGMGSWLNVPLRIERRYDYEVEGGTPKPEEWQHLPAGRHGATPGAGLDSRSGPQEGRGRQHREGHGRVYRRGHRPRSA